MFDVTRPTYNIWKYGTIQVQKNLNPTAFSPREQQNYVRHFKVIKKLAHFPKI